MSDADESNAASSEASGASDKLTGMLVSGPRNTGLVYVFYGARKSSSAAGVLTPAPIYFDD